MNRQLGLYSFIISIISWFILYCNISFISSTCTWKEALYVGFVFICVDEVGLWFIFCTLGLTLLSTDSRQDFLATCKIYMRLWRRHRWLYKLRQWRFKKNLQSTHYSINSFSPSLCFYPLCGNILVWISSVFVCRAEFDGYCEGELIKVCHFITLLWSQFKH